MRIVITKLAQKQIKALDGKTKERIKNAILELPMGDVNKLKGYETKYRLRVGDYRVIYDQTANDVEIRAVLPRGEAYKKL